MELIAMALILAAIVVTQFYLYEKNGLKNVNYTISISVPEAYENDEIEIVEEIENAKRLPLVWARSEISCSPYLTFKWQKFIQNEQNVQRGLISGIFALRGYQKCRRVWKVRCEKRGIMTIDNATVTISDLFGLTKKAKVFKVFDSVRVLPIPADMETDNLSGDLFIGNMQVRRFVLPDPFMISGAREYSGREPMNRIHWAQTARTGRLMAYNNEFTTERRVMIILNMQRGKAYFQPLSDNTLELQIKAAAFALDYCQKTGAECALAANTPENLIVPAASGYEHTINVLRLLAELENECGERIDDLISELDFNEITDVFLITPFVSEKVGEFLSGLSSKGKCCKIFTANLVDGDENVPQNVEIISIPSGTNVEGGTNEQKSIAV